MGEGHIASPAAKPAPKKVEKKARKEAPPASVEDDEGSSSKGTMPSSRPIATGAVARVRRKRKQWAKRNDEVSTASNMIMLAAAAHELPLTGPGRSLGAYIQSPYGSSGYSAF